MAAEPGASLAGGRLAERLSEIAASAAPEDMLEPALRAIVAESGAAAGAICFFDSRQDLLRLAAEVGLSDEGCRQLRAVRRGAATGWDIPLHGLLNRRAYLIDSAAQNRYVPPLVEPPSSMRAVVCVPLHAGPSPLGSLILVAVAPRSFVERDIHALEAPLGVLVTMIQATRRRGGEQPSRPPAAPPPPPARAEGPDADRVQLLIASLAATERERSRLATAVEAAAAERAEQARVQATLEARAAEHAAEVRRLTERLASEQARLQAALETAAAEHAAEVQRLTEGLASEHSRLRAAETAAAEHAAEVERLTGRLASEQARFEAALEKAAAERAAEIERLTERFASERARLETPLETSAAEVERLTGHLASEQARFQAALESAVAEHAAEVERLTERFASEQARLETALATSAAQVERQTRHYASEQARFETALETAAAERAAEVEGLTERFASDQRRLETALATSAAEVERLSEQLTLEQARFQAALDKAAAERAAEIERLTERFASEQGRLETALATSAPEVERLTGQLASEQARLHAALETAAAEDAAEFERLTERLESAVAREAEQSRLVTELERELADLRRPPVRETSATPPGAPLADRVLETPAPDVRPATPMPTVAPREGVAVLDTGAAWPSVGPGGESVTVVSPDADVAVRLTELAPGCVVVNLAAPGALEALAALRAGGWTTPVRGCLAATAHAVSLGAVEAMARPLDADAIQSVIGAHAARGARVLIAGTDVDFFAALREALGRAGLSVSMAWDAHQVDDLLAMVRPDIALIDLALGPRDLRPIVAKLASLDPVPTVVLVLGTDPASPHFSGAMTYPTVATRARPLDQLLAKALEKKGPVADGRR